jgi:hypothetical protein
MQNESIEATIRQRFSDLAPVLNERGRRLWAATEAKALGYGGVSLVARATGISRRAIHVGLQELAHRAVTQPDLLRALEALVEPTARGDPESPLRWTCKGVRRLAARTARPRVSDRTPESR